MPAPLISFGQRRDSARARGHFRAPGSGWLTRPRLYIASLGYCVVLAPGAICCANLLVAHRWRLLVPFVVPLLFVGTALSLNHRLDARNQQAARSPEIQTLRQETIERMQARPVRLQEAR